MVETTINAQTKNYLKAEELARIIKSMQFPEAYAAQIYNFFTDVSVSDIDKFCASYQVSDIDLMRYYKAFVKGLYPNPELEEMLFHV